MLCATAELLLGIRFEPPGGVTSAASFVTLIST
jgi:hypothetical protein